MQNKYRLRNQNRGSSYRLSACHCFDRGPSQDLGPRGCFSSRAARFQLRSRVCCLSRGQLDASRTNRAQVSSKQLSRPRSGATVHEEFSSRHTLFFFPSCHRNRFGIFNGFNIRLTGGLSSKITITASGHRVGSFRNLEHGRPRPPDDTCPGHPNSRRHFIPRCTTAAERGRAVDATSRGRDEAGGARNHRTWTDFVPELPGGDEAGGRYCGEEQRCH